MIKILIFLFIIITSVNTQAMELGSFFKLDVGYQTSEFINDDSNQSFNFSGVYFDIGYNSLHRKMGEMHTYWGLGLEFNQQDNTANNKMESEQAQHISPNIFYRFIWKNFSLKTSYSYVFAKHEGTGLRHTNLDFTIHKINLQLSYILNIKPNWYFDVFYKFGTGLVFDLDNDHSYSDHVFGVGLIYQFGDDSSLKSSQKNKTKGSKQKGSRKKGSGNFFLY